mmetsp:Transcript_2295/g.6091  ORF Transcript_2295/g.6091 Transcript_2295/m.6091 type:complete len:83 (+) Transcript_2295:730-978(+)
MLVSNSLFALALCYYHYITFLGYSGESSLSLTIKSETCVTVLPFLKDAVYFLYPCALIAVLYVVSLILGMNCSVFALGFYFG